MSKMFGLARLGRDAEIRTTSQGESVATLALAFSYGRKGSDGNWRPAHWHRFARMPNLGRPAFIP